MKEECPTSGRSCQKWGFSVWDGHSCPSTDDTTQRCQENNPPDTTVEERPFQGREPRPHMRASAPVVTLRCLLLRIR
jgi:hypothetical protein